jgi:hypothetical protein
MTKTEFFYYLGQGVKYSPTVYISGKPFRLNTFATAREPTDLMAENLGKTVFDRSGSYFYSRKWEALNKPASNVVFDYPMLICYDIRPSLQGMFDKQATRQCSQLILQCLYPNIEKQEADVKKAAKALLLDEIYEITSEMMREQMNWIKGAAYATVTYPVVGTFTGWFNLDWVVAQQGLGNVTTYVVYDQATNAFRLRNKNLNRTQGGAWVDDLSKDALCGIQVPYEFCEYICSPSTNWPHGFNVPLGYFQDDAEAAANGVPLRDVYLLSLANIYGMPMGMLKQRVE